MRKPMLITAAAGLLISMSVSAGNIHFPEELVPLQVGERVIESSLTHTGAATTSAGAIRFNPKTRANVTALRQRARRVMGRVSSTNRDR